MTSSTTCPMPICYGIYIDGELVSSLRHPPPHAATCACRRPIRCSTDVLDPLLDQGVTFIDPGRFTADYEASLAYPALPFLTLRIAVMATWHFRVKYCLSLGAARARGVLPAGVQLDALREARYYHGLSFPMELWACDCPVVYPQPDGALPVLPLDRGGAAPAVPRRRTRRRYGCARRCAR